MKSETLILASTSTYRAELLRRLGLGFSQEAPQVEERAEEGETPAGMARRLARAKAAHVAARFPEAWVIGSDQVAALGEAILRKPRTMEAATEQLHRCSTQEVVFSTAICLTRHDRIFHHLDVTRVKFRELSDAEIQRYVDRDRPLKCAGAFKAEALGIALFERIDSVDPTGLIGLPLIALGRLLREAGFAVP
ncbi:MAG: nucleoside triphosphate pyrophosphatase [Xanthomonadales bacterium]|nr:nucleoside triphosphate pyrophosphatase [Xanthomonadales bacterium]